MDRISVIIATYNRREMLKRLLESFSGLECRIPVEFIIIDDCSDDGTESVVETWKRSSGSAEVIFQRLPVRSGPSRARNTGILLSTGTILAFTDSDCIVDPAWLDALYGLLVRCPELAGAGGRVLAVGDDIYSRYNTLYRVLDPPSHINAVITANCMLWKQPVVEAGMFDEYFTIPGGEEIALSMKLWLSGCRFGYEENAVVYHDYRQNLKTFYSTFYHYGNGEHLLFEYNLAGYLRYMKYPEQIHASLGFRHPLAFQMVFFLRMVCGIAAQCTGLWKVSRSCRECLSLNFLYALHQVAYHLGRGTFSGALGKIRKRSLRSGSPP